MKEPKKYILDEWDSMCAKANKGTRSACPLLEDEVLVEMHKYLGAILIENEELRKLVDLARDEYLEENSDGETDCVTPYDYYPMDLYYNNVQKLWRV